MTLTSPSRTRHRRGGGGGLDRTALEDGVAGGLREGAVGGGARIPLGAAGDVLAIVSGPWIVASQAPRRSSSPWIDDSTLDERPDLARAGGVGGGRDVADHLDHVIEVVGFEDEVAAERLGGLGERAVGDRDRPVAVADGAGAVGEVEGGAAADGAARPARRRRCSRPSRRPTPGCWAGRRSSRRRRAGPGSAQSSPRGRGEGAVRPSLPGRRTTGSRSDIGAGCGSPDRG